MTFKEYIIKERGQTFYDISVKDMSKFNKEWTIED